MFCNVEKQYYRRRWLVRSRLVGMSVSTNRIIYVFTLFCFIYSFLFIYLFFFFFFSFFFFVPAKAAVLIICIVQYVAGQYEYRVVRSNFWFPGSTQMLYSTNRDRNAIDAGQNNAVSTNVGEYESVSFSFFFPVKAALYITQFPSVSMLLVSRNVG